jgi:single-stranded-DNA-specific exonuclease
VPGFDLLGGLTACGDLLTRFGGHSAAAGLEIEQSRLELLRARFAEHAAGVLGAHPAVRSETIDAVIGGESLGFRVADQLARLGPFGKGNPELRVLVPSARISDVTAMGEGERHARFALHAGPARVSGVGFGVGSKLVDAAEQGPQDVSVRLELNEWNGAVFPRVVLGEVYPQAERQEAQVPACPIGEYSARLIAALPGREAATGPAIELGAVRESVDRTRASDVASVAALASAGAPILVLCADVRWRRALVEAAASPARFGGGGLAMVSARGSLVAGEESARRLASRGRGGVVLADWPALAILPDLARQFAHVVVADPAPDPWVEAAGQAGTRDGGGWAHTLASALEPGLAIRALELRHPTRAALTHAYRALRARTQAGPVGTEDLRQALEALPGGPRSPEWGAEAIRILAETGVLRIVATAPELKLEVVSSVRGELERSPSFVANREAHEECVRFLTRGKEQSSIPIPAAA